MPDTSVKQYKTDFIWPAWFSVGWVVIMGVAFFYLMVRSSQPPELIWEWNETEIISTTIIGILVAFGIPLLGWKQVELDHFKKELRIQKLFDKLAGTTRIYSYNKIKEVKKKYHFWSRSEILHITFQSGKELKFSTTFLKKGYELDRELLNLNVE